MTVQFKHCPDGITSFDDDVLVACYEYDGGKRVGSIVRLSSSEPHLLPSHKLIPHTATVTIEQGPGLPNDDGWSTDEKALSFTAKDLEAPTAWHERGYLEIERHPERRIVGVATSADDIVVCSFQNGSLKHSSSFPLNGTGNDTAPYVATCVDFSADHVFGSSTSGAVTVFSLETQTCVGTARGEAEAWFVKTIDANLFAAGWDTGSVRFFDLRADLEPVATLKTDAGAVALSPFPLSSSNFLVGAYDDVLRVCDLRTAGETVKTLFTQKLEGAAWDFLWKPDSSSFLLINCFAGASVWSVADGSVQQLQKLELPESWQKNPKGSLIYCGAWLGDSVIVADYYNREAATIDCASVR